MCNQILEASDNDNISIHESAAPAGINPGGVPVQSVWGENLLNQLLNQLSYPFPVSGTEILNVRERGRVPVGVRCLSSAFPAEFLVSLHLLALCRDRLSARRLNSYNVSLY